MMSSRSFSSKNDFLRVVFPGLLLLFVPLSVIVTRILHNTSGHYIYPFDDTYIHLTIADNLLKGSWGINEGQFVSASSSVLYTLTLALFRVFSTSTWIPFIVNCIAAILIVVALHLWLKKHFVSPFGQVSIIGLLVFFTPIPLLVISGMEHTFQCLFCFLFIFYFSDWLEENRNVNKPLPIRLLFFSILAATIRYEGLFLIAIAVLLLLVHKKVAQTFILIFTATLPLVIFGFASVVKGNYFLPNSILVKSDSFKYSNVLQLVSAVFFEKLIIARNGMAALATQRLLIFIPVLFFAFKKSLRPSYLFILIFLFCSTVLQLSFASTGYLYRYEAYLFFCCTVIAAVLFYKFGRQFLSGLTSVVSRLAATALAFFLLFPVMLRSFTAWDKISQASTNIYEQQFQMALFTKRYYDQKVVALNDIGAVGYYTNSKIIDLWGLADIDVTKSKRVGRWTSGLLDSICRRNNVQMAIVYDSWFSDSLTKRWSKAATWRIRNNVICGDSIVSFYSLDSSSKNMLRYQLRNFEQQLPASVMVKYY